VAALLGLVLYGLAREEVAAVRIEHPGAPIPGRRCAGARPGGLPGEPDGWGRAARSPWQPGGGATSPAASSATATERPSRPGRHHAHSPGRPPRCRGGGRLRPLPIGNATPGWLGANSPASQRPGGQLRSVARPARRRLPGCTLTAYDPRVLLRTSAGPTRHSPDQRHGHRKPPMRGLGQVRSRP
jgi:hypothetical protein